MESVTQPILQLMRDVLKNKEAKPYFLPDNAPVEQFKLCAQLIKSGYLDGSCAQNNVGIPCAIAILDVTLAGREYMEHLEAQIKSNSLSGKMRVLSKKAFWATLGSGGIGGMLLTLLTQYLTKKFGLQ